MAVDDAATVAEDAAATAIDVLANDTDVDGGPIAIAAVTRAGQRDGGDHRWRDRADLSARRQLLQHPGARHDPDTFTYTLTPGGSTATVSVTVTCVDDDPVAVADAATVVEDAAATAIDVLANDTDVDGGPIAIDAVTQPANGTVVITGGGTGLTYQPDAELLQHPAGTTLDTFTYTLTPGGSTATVSVTVTCVDDPPVAVDDAATVLEDAAATAITVLTNDTDIDAGPNAINTVTEPANGTVVITGGGTGLTYQPDSELLQQPARHHARHVHLHAQRRLDGDGVDDGDLCQRHPGRRRRVVHRRDDAIGNTAFVVDDPTDGAPTLDSAAQHDHRRHPRRRHRRRRPRPARRRRPARSPPTTVAASRSRPTATSPSPRRRGRVAPTPATASTTRVSDQNTADRRDRHGTVTIAISGCVWYVSNNAAGNSGTSTAPFDTLAQAETASPAGHTIFVFDGDNTTTGYAAGFTLKANQRLIGEAANLVVGSCHVAHRQPGQPADDHRQQCRRRRPRRRQHRHRPRHRPARRRWRDRRRHRRRRRHDHRRQRSSTPAPLGTQPGLELNATSGTWNISNLTVTTNGADRCAADQRRHRQLHHAGTIRSPPPAPRASKPPGRPPASARPASSTRSPSPARRPVPSA